MDLEREIDLLGARVEALKVGLITMSTHLSLPALHAAGREMNAQAETLTAVALGSTMSDRWREELARRLRELGSAWSNAAGPQGG